jgi:hypothetical protein
MQTITRHGGGSHFVRPDRVYRTGVLTSTMGYEPHQDVEAVAAAFTQYPMDLQAPAPSGAMSGLGRAVLGTTNLGLIKRLQLRWAGYKARRQMYGLRGLHGLGRGQGDARLTNVGYPMVGLSIQPATGVFSKEDMANNLMQSNMPAGYAASQAGYSWNHWVTQRWNG